MTIATRVQERIPLPPVQARAELRIAEQVDRHVDIRQHAAMRRAVLRGDRLTYLRLAEVHEAHAVDALRRLWNNTPAFTGELPLNDGCLIGDGGAA